MIHSAEAAIGRWPFSMKAGHVARLAHGAVEVRYGETIVLVTVVSAKAREDIDFFPMTVDYREKTSAAGKIPGGFFKREGRPTTKEILTCRLMDRPIRPRFPEGYRRDILISALVLSADTEVDPDILAANGASAALCLSPLPFDGPIGTVRVGRKDGQLILNPTYQEVAEGDLELVIAATDDAIVMVEAGAKQVEESAIIDALEFGHAGCREMIRVQRQLVEKASPEKDPLPPIEDIEKHDVYRTLERDYAAEFARRFTTTGGKKVRGKAVDSLVEEITLRFVPEGMDDKAAKEAKKFLAKAIDKLEKKVLRRLILEGRRIDGRPCEEIRPITCEVGFLPRTHGSALFTRGETQALVVTTLGTGLDEQIIDGLVEEYSKKFMLHYNFPPFCTGEVKPIRGPSRREIGHGNLAERAIEPMLPEPEKFPYTIRIVSDVLESNGSSSMATVCGSTLALMDAGVHIKQPVAGIAMGLVKEGNEVRILSDILGTEDKFGDMDFKVAGTQFGITALQMDIKTTGLSRDIMSRALAQAREGRIHILKIMMQALDRPRAEISVHAPRVFTCKINPEKIGLLIGPGGKNIRKLQEETGTTIEVDEDGTVHIYSTEGEGAERARQHVEGLAAEAEMGKIYDGTVMSIKDFGAFVEILPNQEGLVHISELADGYVAKVTDVVKIGDAIKVKVINIDATGRIKLSAKEAARGEGGAGGEGAPPSSGPPPGEGGRERGPDRGPRRDRDRRGGGGGGGRDGRPPRGDRMSSGRR